MAETTKAAKTALPKEVFAVEVTNHELLKLAYHHHARLGFGLNRNVRGQYLFASKASYHHRGLRRAA